MAMGSQQLAEDYGQLKDTLELYPNISIVKTGGQPPDNYEIEYRVRGYIKDPDGMVTIAQNHKVQISLPFGYPHFAPIAKPLSPIFHPDFDPAAIRIADRWQQNPSLPDLVLYLGEMISGSAYNLEDPFNQEAADWYQAHQKQLPLDSLSIADIEEPTAELGSLVDDTFASLGLENDDFLEPEKPVDVTDIEHIRALFNQNKIFSANKLLTDLSKKADFPDREEMQQKIGKVLRKTDQLFKLAEQLEDMGKLDEALEVIDNLLAIAVDTPGADSLRSRVQQAFLLAQSGGTMPQKRGDRAEKKPEATAKAPTPPSPPRLPVKSKVVPKTVLSYKPLLAIILVLGIGIGTISLYFKDQNVLSQSQANLLKGQLLTDKKEFDSALESLESAKKVLTDLTILRYRKNSLEQEINTLIASPELQEGLKGRILFQGEYIPSLTATALTELATLTDQAQELVGQDRVEEALSLYRQALKYAREHSLDKQGIAINEYIQSLELRQTLALAEKAEQGKNWSEAAKAYRKALRLSGNIKDLGTASDITHRLTAATFRQELDQSKRAFTQSQWQETIRFLERAQQTITANPNVVTEKERKDLHTLLINSRLYLMLSTAGEAYRKKNWPLALREYQNALTLLIDESNDRGATLDESRAKIEKTILMVNIAQIQDKVLIAEGQNDLTKAIAHTKEIQRIIQYSKYTNDPDVQLILQKVRNNISKYTDKLVLNEKILWLEEHYEEIFRTHYATFRGSKLSHPKAVFLKKIDNKQIFTITCLERSHGSTSRLELNYMFNAATGKWSTYND